VAVLAPIAALLMSCGGGTEPSEDSAGAVKAQSQGLDEVLSWNEVVQRAVRGGGAAAALQPRQAAIVHVAMFEALNGIERRFTPIHAIAAQAPGGASRRAAVVGAAYTALTRLFGPTQSFAADLAGSLDALAPGTAQENSESIALGLAWGAQVANEIVDWRAQDVMTGDPYVGSTVPGVWRPTPPANLPMLAPWMRNFQPFILPDAISFRPPRPPGLTLTSPEYTAEFNEVKLVGQDVSVVRTPEQTVIARFWGGTSLWFWNRAAVSEAQRRHTTLSQNARLFAQLNAAIADALIVCWDSKYSYSFWRPITAIAYADQDGNPDTVADPLWQPLLTTPNYPEYYSGHQSISRTAAAIMAAHFGDSTPVEGYSEGYLNGTVSRSFPSFAAAADEALEARIFGGIHFRTAMRDARAVAERIAAYALANAAQPIDDE
jgi:hypothetical protein